MKRSFQCIGGDPSKARNMRRMDDWEDSLWSHKRWELVDVINVNNWYDWCDLKEKTIKINTITTRRIKRNTNRKRKRKTKTKRVGKIGKTKAERTRKIRQRKRKRKKKGARSCE